MLKQKTRLLFAYHIALFKRRQVPENEDTLFKTLRSEIV